MPSYVTTLGKMVKMTLPMSEADLKLAVSEYLEYLTNQGKLYADRLNSGEVIIIQGQDRRRIKLCRTGTADFFVLKQGLVIYLECKSEKGRQSPEQKAFEILVKAQGASYYLVRSVDEIGRILRRE